MKARATLTEITVNETDDTLTLKISDNGCGMTAETLKAVTDPFYTTRTTRKVGMGLPLLREALSVSHQEPKANTPKTTELRLRRFSIKSILIIRRSETLFQVL